MVSSENIHWHGIIPLHSTRKDVKRLLGSNVDSDGIHYRSRIENAFINYSVGPCSKYKNKGGWNVPFDTVLSISVYPKIKPRFSEYKIDKERYKKEEDPESTNVLYYTDQEHGVSITVDGGIVKAVDYIPAARDDYLRCPDSSK
jgi:hypothetical protein